MIFCDRMEEHLTLCLKKMNESDTQSTKVDLKFLEISSEITQHIHQLEMQRNTPKITPRQLGFGSFAS